MFVKCLTIKFLWHKDLENAYFILFYFILFLCFFLEYPLAILPKLMSYESIISIDSKFYICNSNMECPPLTYCIHFNKPSYLIYFAYVSRISIVFCGQLIWFENLHLPNSKIDYPFLAYCIHFNESSYLIYACFLALVFTWPIILIGTIAKSFWIIPHKTPMEEITNRLLVRLSL